MIPGEPMSDLASEVRAYIHTFKTIRESHPDLPQGDEFFEGSLDAECSLHRIINAMVREYRQESTLAAAMENTIGDIVKRKEDTERRAAKLLLQLQATLQKIEAETGETPVFYGASYSLTLTPVGIANLTIASDGKDKPIHERTGAKKVEALYLQRLEASAKIDQIKAEEAILKERRQGLVSEIARIDQEVIEEAPSLFSPGMKTAKLPMVDITVSDMPDGVVITDMDVLADKYLIHEPPPPPPPPKPNIPAILMDIKNKIDVWGAQLTNGGKRVSYRVKKPS
jgi:hypothetical protein